MKTFEDFSRKNLDIDPYGEEDWNEDDPVDWNKIKIVRPTKKDVGKKVMITPNSEFYNDGDSHNPIDKVGVIEKIGNRPLMPYDVMWHNGRGNCYRGCDLTLINNTINEGYLNDYYNIFGFKSLINPFNNDQSNIKKSSHFRPDEERLNKKDVISIIRQVVDFYYDEKHVKFIGSGFYGSAYETIDKTKVLKITTDSSEVKRAEKFRKINTDCVVDYYDVRRLEVYRGKEKIDIGLWAIILEKVEPLKDFEKTIWKKFKRSILAQVYPGMTDSYKLNNLFFDENKNVNRDLPPYIYDTCVKMDNLIKDMIKVANRYNVDFEDIHENNLGKTKDGNYKFFDVRSSGHNTKKLPLKPIKINL